MLQKLIFTLVFLSNIIVFSQNDGAFVIYSSKGKKVSLEKMLTDISQKEAIFFGEQHDNPIAHWIELQVLKRLEATYHKDLVVGFEMYEHDQQELLMQFLTKKLSEKQRVEAYQLILDNALAISCNAGSVSDIDELGINPATFKVMHKCIDELSITPDYVLLDGTVWDNIGNTRVELVPKGDDTYLSIAAAAIVAKVRRDEYMVKLHELFPIYDWDSNKGYLSPSHIAAIKKNGICKYHRNQYVRNFI